MAVHLKIPEEFYIGNVSEVANGILRALHGNREVVIDLSGVTRIDSAAIQAAMSAAREAEYLGAKLSFIQSDIVRNFASSIGVSL